MLLVDTQNGAATLQARLTVFYIIKHIPHNSANLPLGICPREITTFVHRKKLIHTQSFIVLFIIINSWKQSRCPLTGEWLAHPYNGILLSDKKL